MPENQFGNIKAPLVPVKEAERDTRLVPNLGQQKKIIAVLGSGNYNLLSKGADKITVTDDQRKDFFKKIASGETGDDHFKDLLLKIKSPIYKEVDPKSPVGLYALVNSDSHGEQTKSQMKALIAWFTIKKMDRRDNMTAKDLGTFLEKYPEPLTFENATRDFLDEIEKLNSVAKRQQYEVSLKKFMTAVYGKRQEYYDQIKLLQVEADEKRMIEEGRKKIENFKIEKITDLEAQQIFDKVEIHGSRFKGQSLTCEILKEEGLLPKNKIHIGDSTIWFSSSGYELGDGRVAVVAYMEKRGKVTARSYYRSNSQGVWRYLPEYTTDEDGDLSWYGKGHSEESVTLPVLMQKALSEITHDGASILKLKNDPQLVFAGTARQRASAYIRSDATYYLETEAIPQKLNGNFYSDHGVKTPPEQVRLTNEQSPDFSAPLTEWKQKTNLYGEISIEVFPSRDGKLKFMFCRDVNGRAWVGGIEDDSETQSTGLKQSWIKGGDLATPAYEYLNQTGGYGNEKISKNFYVDMYENYLKKIPIIQEYIKSKSSAPS